jgi:RNA polymerase sigma factor (sigma-70 family)
VYGGGLNAAVRYLRSLFDASAGAGVSDGQLLERFVTQRESAALEALALRHGPMIWGVCRRILRNEHDVEDAFQATFLVLARRAVSVVPRENVGNWLYGVAFRTAMKARVTRAKCRSRESDIANAPEPEAASVDPRHDLAELLDGELNRLPDKYRTPIVLCELEGLTHGEAAERLGWPIGTVSGRLSRARAILAKRLARRGAAATGGTLAVLLAQQQSTASASVSAQLLSSTVKAATLIAAGQTKMAGVVSSEVAALTGEVLKAMRYSRIKVAAAVLLAFVLTGTGLWQTRTWAEVESPADQSFHVTVTDIIRDDNTIVTQLDFETPPGITLEVFCDKDSRGTFTLSSDSTDGKGGAASHSQVVIFGDEVESKRDSTSIVKFMIAYKVGRISSSTSQADPMPANAKQLSDLLTVPIKTGDYKFGQPTKLATFKNSTYTVVVTKPK